MTMVALLGNPVESASPLTLATPHTLSQMLTEPTVTNPTPQLIETPISNSIASLRDIPTDVPTTAATSDVYDADDDARCRTCPSINDDNTTPHPFLKKLDALHRITLLKELDALQDTLHKELNRMRSNGTLPPCTTDATYVPTIVITNHDRDQTVNSDERYSNETHHDENQHSNHGYAHPNDNHASDTSITEISDHAACTANDSRRDDHQHDDKNKSNATEQAAHDNNTCEHDGCIQPMSPMRHSRQYTPTFPIIGHATNNQHKSQNDLAPSAMKQREVETTNVANTPDKTLAQLWIVLKQLEEINIQFARWLDTLTIKKTTTTPDNTPGNQTNLMDAPPATTPTIIQSIPPQHNPHPAYTFLATRVKDPTGGMFL